MILLLAIMPFNSVDRLSQFLIIKTSVWYEDSSDSDRIICFISNGLNTESALEVLSTISPMISSPFTNLIILYDFLLFIIGISTYIYNN